MNRNELVKGVEYAVEVPGYDDDRHLYQAKVLDLAPWREVETRWATTVEPDTGEDGQGVLVLVVSDEKRLEVLQPENFVCLYEEHQKVDDWLQAERKWVQKTGERAYLENKDEIQRRIRKALKKAGLQVTGIDYSYWSSTIEIRVGAKAATKSAPEPAFTE